MKLLGTRASLLGTSAFPLVSNLLQLTVAMPLFLEVTLATLHDTSLPLACGSFAPSAGYPDFGLPSATRPLTVDVVRLESYFFRCCLLHLEILPRSIDTVQ